MTTNTCGSEPAGETCQPIVIDASDGTSTEHVEVNWTTDSCAVAYKLYRTQFEGEVPTDLIADLGQVAQFFDTSAVPLVIYYYQVRGIDESGQVCTQSNIDPGHRLGEGVVINDCDGDGISDEQEIADGTDPCDPGSGQKRLKSPLYAKYNTFLSQFNFLELIANGTKAVRPVVTVYDISGNVIGQQALDLEPGQQFDVDINALVSTIDTYGIVRVDFNDEAEGVSLLGRMSNYRPNPDGATFSFAFAKELINPVTGPSFATGNSIDPQGAGFLVPNWAEMINVENFSQTFTHNLRNQAGDLIESRVLTMPPLSERDVNAGHENGAGVYLSEVIPHNGAAGYLLTVSRYSSNSFASDEADTYNFAFALEGKKGTGDTLYAPISNEAGDCWSITNWVEIANVRDKLIVANATFRNDAGVVVAEEQVPLRPFSQYHLNGNLLLSKGSTGTVEVTGSSPGSIISQSLFYYHDCENNLTQTAYPSPAKVAGLAVQVGSYNTFLGIMNALNVINTTSDAFDYTVEVRHAGDVIGEQSGGLTSAGSLIFDLNDKAAFNTAVDTNGTVTVIGGNNGIFIGEVVRFRPDPLDPRKADFAMQTPLN